MSKRIKLTDSELANLNNQLIRARMGRMRSIVLNEPPSIDGGGGSDDAGGGGGSSFPVPDGEPFMRALTSPEILNATDDNDSDNDGWFGRQSVLRLNNGNLIRTFKHGAAHNLEAYAIIQTSFSDDDGLTWTDPDVLLGGGSVTGIPLRPVGAGNPSGNTRGPVHCILTACPNGDIIGHMWSSNYTDDQDGGWQVRWIGGMNGTGTGWETPVKIVFDDPYDLIDGLDGDKLYFGEDRVVLDSTIYATVRYDSREDASAYGGVREHHFLSKSLDNGENWTIISQINLGTDDPIPNGSCETSLEYVGNGTFIILMRMGQLKDAYFYQCPQGSFGDNNCTWTYEEVSAQLGLASHEHLGRTMMYTRAHLQGESNWWEDRVLIIQGYKGGFDNISTGTRHNIAITGIIQSYNPVVVQWYPWTPVADVGYDGGYGDIYHRSGDTYPYLSYRSPTSYYDGSCIQVPMSLEWLAANETLFDFDFSAGSAPTGTTVTNPDSANLTIGFPGTGVVRFIRTTDTNVASTLGNYLQVTQTYTYGFFTVDLFRHTGFTVSSIGLRLYTDNNNTIFFFKNGSGSNTMTIQIVDGGVTIANVDTTVPLNRYSRLAIEVTQNGVVRCYLGNGTTWTQCGSTYGLDTPIDIGAFNVRLGSNSHSSDAQNDVAYFRRLTGAQRKHPRYLPSQSLPTTWDYEHHPLTGTGTTGLTITNPDSSVLAITKNNKLIFTKVGEGNITSSVSNRVVIDTIDGVSTARQYGVVNVWVNRDTGYSSGGTWRVGLWQNSSNLVNVTGSGTTLGITVIVGGVTVSTQSVTSMSAAMSTRIMIAVLEGVIRVWYYNTTTKVMTLVGDPVFFQSIGTWKPEVGATAPTAESVNNAVSFDDIFITDYEYFGRQP